MLLHLADTLRAIEGTILGQEVCVQKRRVHRRPMELLTTGMAMVHTTVLNPAVVLMGGPHPTMAAVATVARARTMAADRMAGQPRPLIAAAIADQHRLMTAAQWDAQCLLMEAGLPAARCRRMVAAGAERRPTAVAGAGHQVAPVAEATHRLPPATAAVVATVAEATPEVVTNEKGFRRAQRIRRPNLGRRFLLVALFGSRREIRRIHFLRDGSRR